MGAFTYNVLLKSALSSRAPEQFRKVLTLMEDEQVPKNTETERLVRELSYLESESWRDHPAKQADVARPPLADGWQATVDPNSGGTYYWHASDPAGTTTWQCPV